MEPENENPESNSINLEEDPEKNPTELETSKSNRMDVLEENPTESEIKSGNNAEVLIEHQAELQTKESDDKEIHHPNEGIKEVEGQNDTDTTEEKPKSEPQTSTDSEAQEQQTAVPVIQVEGKDITNEQQDQQVEGEDITTEQQDQQSDGEPVEAGAAAATTCITPVPGQTDIVHSRQMDQEKVEPAEDQIEQEPQPTSRLENITEEEDNESKEDEEDEEEFDRDEAIESYKVLLSEFEKNQTNHNHLQHKIAEYLAKKKADEKPDPGRNVTDQEQRFQKCMDALEQLQAEAKSFQQDFECEEEHLKNQQQIKQESMEEAWKVFKAFVSEKSVTAVHSRTGRKLTMQEIDQYLGMLERKDRDVIQVRLENVKLQNRINKLEALIQQKEQLAEGLHMIDFEQLRINNVDLNEKIEDRNEEIHKLQKKVTSTVQVLAHLKEKLQFVQAQNSEKEAQLKELDQEVAKKRDALNRLKHAKDAVRSDNTHLKQKGGLVSHPVLLKDFEEQIDLRESMQARLENIQQRHSELTLICNKLKEKIDRARVLPL